MQSFIAAIRCVASLLIVGSAVAVAQVPPGHYVVGTALPDAFTPSPWTGPAGLFVGHPRGGGMLQVTGLPASLVTRPASSASFGWGISSVLLLPSGDLLLGSYRAPSFPAEIYRVHLGAPTGSTFPATCSLLTNLGVGVGANGGLVTGMALLDANRIVVTCWDVGGGPIGAGPTRIGEVDLASGQVTPWVAVSAAFPAGGSARAVCVDQQGGFAYFAGAIGLTISSTLHQVPLPVIGVPSVVTQLQSNLPIQAFTLRYEATRGSLLLSGRQSSGNQSLLRIQPTVGGAVTAIGPGTSTSAGTQMPAFAIEPATGDVLFAGVASNGVPGIYHDPNVVVPTFLTSSYGGGMIGSPFAMEVMPDPAPYGLASTATLGGPIMSWSRGPLAGGLPLLGNANFALQLDVPVGATFLAGSWFASFANVTPTPVGNGLMLNINLGAGAYLGSGGIGVVSGVPTVGLPIPNLAVLRGLDVYFQALTFTAFSGGIAIGGSEGAQVHIL